VVLLAFVDESFGKSVSIICAELNLGLMGIGSILVIGFFKFEFTRPEEFAYDLECTQLVASVASDCLVEPKNHIA
jgi:hypothetical protein